MLNINKLKVSPIIIVIILILSVGTALALNIIVLPEEESLVKEKLFSARGITSSQENRIINMSNYIKETKNDPQEINSDIFDYTKYIVSHNDTDETLNYIDNIIYSGADCGKVIKIYEFWLDTNGDISLVGQMCEHINKYEGEFFAEEIFNLVTENRHGVLDYDGVQEWLEKGMTIHDMKTANVLSRKGVFTITEILDKKVNNMSWAEIVESIYALQEGGNISIAPVTIKDSMKDNDIDILNSMEISKFTAETTPVILNKSSLKIHEIENINESKTQEELDKLNILIPIESDNPDNEKALGQIKHLIINNGISEEKIENLLDEGYTYSDILNSSYRFKETGENIDLLVKTESEEEN